jgi:hypothetical protein
VEGELLPPYQELGQRRVYKPVNASAVDQRVSEGYALSPTTRKLTKDAAHFGIKHRPDSGSIVKVNYSTSYKIILALDTIVCYLHCRTKLSSEIKYTICERCFPHGTCPQVRKP